MDHPRRPGALAPSTVHHILSDLVYIGTAYANRYEYVAPKKPRIGSPRCEEKTCRRRRPRDQWIAIPVPALVDQEAWDRAQAQMARNALVSHLDAIRAGVSPYTLVNLDFP